MKTMQKIALLSLLVSFGALSQENIPLSDINVEKNDIEYLTLQNFSNDIINIDIYGQEVTLKKNSGAQIECNGNDLLELKLLDINHDYFEVACASIVTISKSFSLTK